MNESMNEHLIYIIITPVFQLLRKSSFTMNILLSASQGIIKPYTVLAPLDRARNNKHINDTCPGQKTFNGGKDCR